MSIQLRDLIGIEKFFTIDDKHYFFKAKEFNEWAKEQKLTLMEKNFIKYKLIDKIIRNQKSSNIRALCSQFELPKSTFYDFQKRNREQGNSSPDWLWERKKRSHAKVYNESYQNLVREIIDKNGKKIGVWKISKIIENTNENYKISGVSVWKIFKILNIAPNSKRRYINQNSKKEKQ